MDLNVVEEGVRALRSVLGTNKVLTEDFICAAYTHDITLYNIQYAMPSIITLPESTEDVQKIIRVSNEHKIPVVPVGGQTSGWGATDSNGGIVIDLSKMNKII